MCLFTYIFIRLLSVTDASCLLFFGYCFFCFQCIIQLLSTVLFFFKNTEIFLLCLKCVNFAQLLSNRLSCVMFQLTYFLKTLKTFFHFLLVFLIVWDIYYLSLSFLLIICFFFQVSTNPFSLYSLVLLYVEQIWSYLLYFLLSEFSLCFHFGFLKCLVIILQNILLLCHFLISKQTEFLVKCIWELLQAILHELFSLIHSQFLS